MPSYPEHKLRCVIVLAVSTLSFCLSLFVWVYFIRKSQ
jgi:hypothetical protein